MQHAVCMKSCPNGNTTNTEFTSNCHRCNNLTNDYCVPSESIAVAASFLKYVNSDISVMNSKNVVLNYNSTGCKSKYSY